MVIETMMFQGNVFQASIGEALFPGPITTKAINRGSILDQSNKSKSYCGKAINRGTIVGKAINHEFRHGVRTNYFSLPNNRLKLTAPSVHAFCFSADVGRVGRGAKKRAPRPAA
jgi:hypothetical protein